LRIYATPSLILRASGSVGLFLVLWLLGAVIAAVGMAVFVEFGTVSVLSPQTNCFSMYYRAFHAMEERRII